MRLTRVLQDLPGYGSSNVMSRWIRRKNRNKPFNAPLQRLGYSKMDGVFPHDGPGQIKRAHTNEYPAIFINRRVCAYKKISRVI